ncbi:MFS general substrate transporter [Fomitiporia mediterranea MF3/22]|uniref:MFS general substrate transporter n=1 Tax=Fomitiporia mediterranea (strain MF3/22) TaxID=694068 RepID=UPI00044089F2|nr:MFS general substrate transporter [Fomitiporia mediterranea MF3/22]EJD03169.1 MFS general substrate transporter [Fomitiporia mediterranea MF3/22]
MSASDVHQGPIKVDVEKHSGDASSVVDSILADDVVENRGDGVSTAYERKSHLINQCLQHEIGFGRYQKELFILSGFGWLADNLWLQGVAVVLPQVLTDLNPPRVEYVTLSLYVGLIIGATTWGSLADVIGRKISWQITLFICGVFGIAAGSAPNFVALCSLIACVGFGVGGNLPVDGALFLEHIPQSHQWLLTFLSAFWSVGQLIGSLIVWVFIANYPVDKSWRYSLYTMGCLTFAMFFCRYIIFELQESSKFLVATGQDEEAIKVLQYIAKRNGRTISLTTEKLLAVSGGSTRQVRDTSVWSSFKRSFSQFSLSHVQPLFSTKRLGINSSLTILIWGIIGLAYPLFNGFLPLYLSDRLPSGSTNQTYRDYSITSVCGIPGSVIACILVDWTRSSGKIAIGGRKMALAVSTALTGLFLFLFTTAKGEASNLGYSCASTLTQNAMYGVLYAYTPEVFPAPHRGTGDALCSAFNRITGILAPVIKITTTNRDGSASSIGPNAPVFVSAALFMVSAFLTLLLPIETAGKAAL